VQKRQREPNRESSSHLHDVDYYQDPEEATAAHDYSRAPSQLNSGKQCKQSDLHDSNEEQRPFHDIKTK
jgi:hypothetical protein